MGKKSKQKSSAGRRSQRRVLDAFQIAENAANGDSESDGDEDLPMHGGVMDARKFLKDQDDMEESEDEELDSDEAFASDDDFDVLDTKFKQSGRKNSHDEEEYDSIDELELIPLSEVWDMDDRDAAKSSGKKIKSTKKATAKEVVLADLDVDLESDTSSHSNDRAGPDADADASSDAESDSGSDSESESDSDSGSESDSSSAFSAFSDEPVTLSKTSAAILASIPRAAAKKHFINETVAESEFGGGAAGQLSFADMLAGLDPQLASLIDASSIPEPEAVPLPRRIQQRNDRKAAYQLSKEQVLRWQDTVRALGRADNLEFPLAAQATENADDLDEDEAAEREADALRAVTESQHESELQRRVAQVLSAGGLDDESNEATFEQTAAARLSKEEVAKRTIELRRMRELMFRDEQRARRIKKIKSKAYRRIHKKERLRDANLVEEEGLGENSDGDEEHDSRRAEERMSLRHKTHGKWAKQVVKSGLTKDASTRAELEEMLRSGEALRRKQLGLDDEQNGGDALDIEREYEADDARAEADEAVRAKLGKGVMGMAFMRAAEARQRAENEAELKRIRQLQSGAGDDDDADEWERTEVSGVNTVKNSGRRTYTPAAGVASRELAEVEEDVLVDSDEEAAADAAAEAKANADAAANSASAGVEKEFHGFSDSEEDGDSGKYDGATRKSANYRKSGKTKNTGSDDDSAAELADGSANPWLLAAATHSSKYLAVTAELSRDVKAAHRINKHTEKLASNRKRSRNDETLISMDSTLNLQAEESRDDGDDEEPMFRRLDAKFTQTELIQEAFAGDDVVSEFQAEKQRIIEAEDDKEEDVSLPGWGDWAGSDQPAQKRRKFVKKIDGVVQKDRRRDKGADNVIINETANQRNLKYLSLSVPYPYELREQYERALRMPLGEEWLSRQMFQKATKPRVSVKQGVVVDPLKAPF